MQFWKSAHLDIIIAIWKFLNAYFHLSVLQKKKKKEMRETGCYAENSLFVLLDSFLVFIVVETLRMAFHPSCVSSPLCRGPAKGPFSM